MSRHARLPLWHDQSSDQKLETLHQLVMDLYRYQLDDVLSQLEDILDEHQPLDDKEREDVATIKQLIRAHPNIMNMNCEVGHITASAVIVDITSHQVLLHFHKRLNRWLQVGGHGDYETDFALVAMREAQEETGLRDLAFLPADKPIVPIDYDVHSIPQNKDFPEHLHLDFRYVLTTSQPDALSPEDGESAQFKWLAFDEALSLTDIDDSLKRLLRKAQRLVEQYNI